jgi:glutathione S-transferase
MKLHYHPISSFSQKTLMGLHEKAVAFEPQLVNIGDAAAREAYRKINPIGKLPTLVLDDGWTIPESAIILEYVDTHFDSGTRLIPADKDQARQARFFERLSDLYLHDPLQTVLFDGRKPEADREPKRVATAKERLDVMFQQLEKHFAKPDRTWVLGDAFSVADCSLAPALAALRFIYPFAAYPNVVSYAGRVTERATFRKVYEEAAPHIAKLMGR